MKITRKNFLTNVCVWYTMISIFIIISEMFSGQGVQTHNNLLMCFVLTMLGIGIVSLQDQLKGLSPLTVLIIQLIVGIGAVVLITYVQGLYSLLHPDAYKDMIRSYLMFFFPGAAYYYWTLKKEVIRQNEALKIINDLSPTLEENH